jgi:hypothetical protein
MSCAETRQPQLFFLSTPRTENIEFLKSCDAINAQLGRKMQSRRRVRHANGHGTSNDFAKVLLRVAFLAVLLSSVLVGTSATQESQLNLNQTAMSADKYTTAMRCSVDELGMPELQVSLSDVSPCFLGAAFFELN